MSSAGNATEIDLEKMNFVAATAPLTAAADETGGGHAIDTTTGAEAEIETAIHIETGETTPEIAIEDDAKVLLTLTPGAGVAIAAIVPRECRRMRRRKQLMQVHPDLATQNSITANTSLCSPSPQRHRAKPTRKQSD